MPTNTCIFLSEIITRVLFIEFINPLGYEIIMAKAVSNSPHSKFILSYETIERIESIADTKVLKGMDKTLNAALDKLERKIQETKQCHN